MNDNGTDKSIKVLSRLPPPLTAFVGIATLLLAACGITEAICRYVLQYPSPYNSPLLHEHYPDLLSLMPRFQHLHTLQFFSDQTDALFMYPAPVAVCYRLFYFAAPHELVAFFCFVLLTAFTAAFLFGRTLILRGFGTARTVAFLGFVLLSSYPIWFELKQANMEICSWIFVALGVWCFTRGRGYTAAAFFGIAGALKIIPFFYLGLFLARRQYRQMAFAFAIAVLVTLPSLWLVYPQVLESWRLTNHAVAHFREAVTLLTYPQLGFDHSIFGIIKRLRINRVSHATFSRLLTAYSVVSALTFLTLFFTRIIKLPTANQIICLSTATLLLPPTSFDYTLMSLYIPWAFLTLFAVREEVTGTRSPGLVAAMVCFAILFVPETELILRGLPIAGHLKALTLITLFVIGLRFPFGYFEISPSGPETDTLLLASTTAA